MQRKAKAKKTRKKDQEEIRNNINNLFNDENNKKMSATEKATYDRKQRTKKSKKYDVKEIQKKNKTYTYSDSDSDAMYDLLTTKKERKIHRENARVAKLPVKPLKWNFVKEATEADWTLVKKNMTYI